MIRVTLQGQVREASSLGEGTLVQVVTNTDNTPDYHDIWVKRENVFKEKDWLYIEGTLKEIDGQIRVFAEFLHRI